MKNGDHFHSDHRPKVLSLEGIQRTQTACIGDRAFYFEASWLKEEVEEAWVAGFDWGGGRVVDRLRSVAAGLRSWDKNVLGDLEKE